MLRRALSGVGVPEAVNLPSVIGAHHDREDGLRNDALEASREEQTTERRLAFVACGLFHALENKPCPVTAFLRVEVAFKFVASSLKRPKLDPAKTVSWVLRFLFQPHIGKRQAIAAPRAFDMVDAVTRAAAHRGLTVNFTRSAETQANG